MARFVAQPNVGENTIVTYKAAAATTDADVGKPVKLSATDTVALCADGDDIYGFITSIEPATADGKKIVGVQISGRIWVELDGAAAVGTVVEAAANAAAGTANTSGYGIVSVHTMVSDTVANLAASLQLKSWLVISGTGLDEAIVLIEKQ